MTESTPMRLSSKGTNFAVDLGGVTLPPLLAKRVELQIQDAVLSALAEVGVPDKPDLIAWGDLIDETRGGRLLLEAGLLEQINADIAGRG